MKHLGTQRIETDRLILRKFVMEDAKAMYENWASDEEVTKYLMWPAHSDISVSQEILKEWTKNYTKEDYYQWAICLKENDEPIGNIGVVSQDDTVQMVHIGYCIGRQWWHQGITSEALRGVIGFFLDKLGMQRIESRHDPRNPNSGAVMKKCGMQYEGTLRKADWNNRGICDACYYAILSTDR
ncbi:MAG: GNAT family N-acetyltransferase [Lachnospiraceae bacterium]|nr:GNAT family N-acetyltransferase [Lachnospiraceae bacterium]